MSFTIFLLALLLAGALLRIDLFFNLVYLLIAIYAVSYLWARLTSRKIITQQSIHSHALHGEKVMVRGSIRNTGWLPMPWLEIHASLPVELISPANHLQVIRLGAYAQHNFSYTLNCQRRGYYTIDPLRIRTGDLHGLQTRELDGTPAQSLVVYPRILPLEALGLPTRSPLVSLPARHPLFDDPARLTGVREYQRGDSPRRIHWPATARTQQLLVKQYEPAISRDTLICLNLNRDEYDIREYSEATELGIVAAASIATHIVSKERLGVGLLMEGQDGRSQQPTSIFLPPRRENAYLMVLLETLAHIQSHSNTRSFPDLLRQTRLRLGWGTTIAVITSNEDEALFDALASLQRSGYAVALILIRPRSINSHQQQHAARLGISVYRVWEERDMEKWQ